MLFSKTRIFIHLGWAMSMIPSHAQTLYAFGNPTAEEQQYIEYINRARANPPAEGARLAATTDADVVSACNYFSVDKAMMQTEFNAIPAAPPLAPHASLTTSARSHSQWMLTTGTQAHDETNPANTPWDRITAAGYTFSNAGENIYAYAKTVWHGHAGFEVDWGGTLGGMQDPRGHRDTIHDPDLREIGVGVVMGTNNTVSPAAGPQLVTQDFGTRFSSPNLGTGVAYYDLNSNNFYDIGEGISGLTVNMSGTTTYCTTAAGGGWVVPAPSTSAANRTMTFSGLNVNQTASIAFLSGQNAKADLKLTYSPPTITSSSSATEGNSHNLTFTAVGGATGYTWTRSTMTAAAAENCDATTNVTTAISPAYTLLSTAFKQQGTGSFHLQNPTATSQSFQLNGLYYGGASPSLSFQSCLRTSSADEHFKVQVKTEGETTWQDVYDQTGYGNSGESVFSLKTATLTGMAGKAFRVRFLLSFNGGSYYPSTGTTLGWYVDAINFTNISTLGSSTTQSLTGTSGSFTPAAGTYLISVAPVISGRDFPAAYQTLTVTGAVITTPVINTHPASVTIGTGTTTTFDVAASGGSLSYQWYAGNSGVTTNPVSGATSSSFTTPALPSTASYWVKVSNSAGNVNSNTATATVITPPSINTHPVPVTINSGTTATFNVSAAGTSPTYQWYAGNSGDTANPVSGATTNSFTTPALSSTTSYWVRVSNAVASANSNTATATVITPPTITTHPASVTISTGATTTFTVLATGTSPVYQWYAGNSGNTSNPISGATGSSFTTTALSATASYWVRVSNSAGTADSNTATATVVVPPNITMHPASLTVANGATATFSVSVSGSSPTLQWYVGNTGVTSNPIAGATSNTFTTGPLFTNATYWVRATNSAGFADSIAATVTVVSPPVITDHPASNTIANNTTMTLSVSATGGNLAYQWYSGISGFELNPISGATGSSYTTPQLSSTQYFWVKVSNPAGNANSNTATITVVYPPVILSQPVSPTIVKHSNTTLEVIASGPSLTYQWYNGLSGTTGSPISGATSNSFTTPSLVNNSSYWVRVSNSAGFSNSNTANVATSNTTVNRVYSTWATEIELANGLPLGSLINPSGDYDNDGNSNLVEYAFGASPIVNLDDASRLPSLRSNATMWILRYKKNTALTDITFAPEASSTLSIWKAPGATGAPTGFTDTLISTNGTIQTREAKIPKTTAGDWFLRMKITQP